MVTMPEVEEKRVAGVEKAVRHAVTGSSTASLRRPILYLAVAFAVVASAGDVFWTAVALLATFLLAMSDMG